MTLAENGKRLPLRRRSRQVQSRARDDLARAQVTELQRRRLLAGAIAAIEEHGYPHVTVAHISSRARVSRRTFYELYENREACLRALLEDIVGAVEGELARLELSRLPWCERLREGLGTILTFLDREPSLARICVVDALRCGPSVLGYREAVLGRLGAIVDEGRGAGAPGGTCSRLAAEGAVGAAFAIVYARLLRDEREPLNTLLGELMSILVLPYLGPAAALREQSYLPPSEPAPRRSKADPLQQLPTRLTYRTARVLQAMAEHPGSSNRQVADRAGIADQGQVSKLLARLERLGLASNDGGRRRRGEPNAWTLTGLGGKITQHLAISGADRWKEA